MIKISWTARLGVMAYVALLSTLIAGISQPARAAIVHKHLSYYGADLEKMTLATGVDFEHPGSMPAGKPWPQRTNNYCFTAVVQAMVNYNDLREGLPLQYPSQSDQGPASGKPADEVKGQILYDMDHLMLPPDGPLPVKGTATSRRPYTLANIAYDFGGDPRSQSFGTAYETAQELPHEHFFYHEHIFHTGPEDATMGIARAVARYKEPVIAFVNHAEHSVLVAGVWATGNPLTDDDARITALAVYNPWDHQRWGAYLSTNNYERVSYDDWINATNLPSPWGGVTSWFNQPYQSNGNLDPDPSIGRYQAGPGTHNPKATHWIGNYVIIQRDWHHISANFAFDEDDHLMLQP